MGEFCERRATVLEVFELDRVLLLFVSGSNTWRNECRLVDVPVEVDVRPNVTVGDGTTSLTVRMLVRP